MDGASVALLRDALAPTGWVERTSDFARGLRTSTRSPGGLLLVGTPQDEPWHLTAHLDDESRFGDIPQLAPTLVRWSPPDDAPAHLSVGVERLEAARRGETLLVVSAQVAPVPLLERAWDARKTGATIFALDTGDKELENIAHDALMVPQAGEAGELASFDAAQHLVSAAAGDPAPAGRGKEGLRQRLARLLDVISGPAGPG